VIFHRKSAALGLLAVPFLVGCFEQVAGNSTETENNATARSIRVDSILPDWNRPRWTSTVATLRFDSSNFDFKYTDSSGKDLAVQLTDSIPLPFEVVYWDKAARRGRLHVRIDPVLEFPRCRFDFLWNRKLQVREDSVATWMGISDSQRLAINSVLVDDFESGSLRNLLPDSAAWKTYSSDTNGISSFGIVSGAGRPGKVLHMSYDVGVNTPKWVLATTSLAATPRCLRSIDSVVLWVKGAGTLNAFSVALETIGPSGSWKAWRQMKIDTVWQRVRLRPQDFDTANASTGSIGWNGVRDSVTNLTLLNGGKGDFWVDDIRIYGIGLDDLR
jgi:hypothetical protein